MFVLNIDWSKDSKPTTRETPEEREKGLYTVISQFIDDKTQSLFCEILARLNDKETPEKLVAGLYKKFQLRLIGMTKTLELLMAVSDGNKEKILNLELEIQNFLADILVPKERLPELTWEHFSRKPVQCSDMRVSLVSQSEQQEAYRHEQQMKQAELEKALEEVKIQGELLEKTQRQKQAQEKQMLEQINCLYAEMREERQKFEKELKETELKLEKAREELKTQGELMKETQTEMQARNNHEQQKLRWHIQNLEATKHEDEQKLKKKLKETELRYEEMEAHYKNRNREMEARYKNRNQEMEAYYEKRNQEMKAYIDQLKQARR
jgi:chromosome segregation ATPase